MKAGLVFALVIVITIVLIQITARPVRNFPKEIEEYLKKYGYLNKTSKPDKKELKDAMRKWHKYARVPFSGKFDANETIKLLDKPRCQLPDVVANTNSTRQKRFVLYPRRWANGKLSFITKSYPNNTLNLSKSAVDILMDKAFQAWGAPTGGKLKVTRAENNTRANITINFLSGDHGDGYTFDGPGGILGHAYVPPDGRVHLDNAEKWSNGTSKGINFFSVFLHESGHALGLSHSANSSAIMYPYYVGYNPNVTLSQDDKDGVKALFGSA